MPELLPKARKISQSVTPHPSNPFCTLLPKIVLLKICKPTPWPQNQKYIMNQIFNFSVLCYVYFPPQTKDPINSIQSIQIPINSVSRVQERSSYCRFCLCSLLLYLTVLPIPSFFIYLKSH